MRKRRERNDELRRLRSWKADAIEVLTRWDAVADRVPAEHMKLGAYKSESVGLYIDRLRADKERYQRLAEGRL